MLPIDIQFDVQTQDIVASISHSFIQKIQRKLLEWAYKTANEVEKRGQNTPKSNMIEISDAPGWNWEILSLSDKSHSKENIRSVIYGKIPLILLLSM